MTAVQFKYLVFLVLITIVKAAIANTNVAVTENRLNQCYKDHPFLMQSFILISDEDYNNEAKSTQRKQLIKTEFENNQAEIRGCVDDIIQYAKEQNNPENHKYVVYRLKEVTSIVYAPSSSKEKARAGVR